MCILYVKLFLCYLHNILKKYLSVVSSFCFCISVSLLLHLSVSFVSLWLIPHLIVAITNLWIHGVCLCARAEWSGFDYLQEWIFLFATVSKLVLAPPPSNQKLRRGHPIWKIPLHNNNWSLEQKKASKVVCSNSLEIISHSSLSPGNIGFTGVSMQQTNFTSCSIADKRDVLKNVCLFYRFCELWTVFLNQI